MFDQIFDNLSTFKALATHISETEFVRTEDVLGMIGDTINKNFALRRTKLPEVRNMCSTDFST